MKKVIVTGSTGFIGVNLMKRSGANLVSLNLRDKTWKTEKFNTIHSVIHLAGIAHQKDLDNPSVYEEFNHKLTIDLAEKAKAEGVKQFIFLSSVKVYGDPEDQTIYDENTDCKPIDSYGQSKLDAEQNLLKMQSPEFVVTIIRSPLVYGPGVKGNVLTLLKHSKKLNLLPFKNIENRRSMVYVENLIDIIFQTIESKQGDIIIASDKRAYSTSEFINTICKEMEVKTPFIVCPRPVKAILKLLVPKIYSRLFSSFLLDSTDTFSRLNYSPKYSMGEGIAAMATWYKTKQT